METPATQPTERPRSSRTLLYVLLILCVLSIVFLTVWMNRYSYQTVQTSNSRSTLHRTNRFTGKTQTYSSSDGWQTPEEREARTKKALENIRSQIQADHQKTNSR